MTKFNFIKKIFFCGNEMEKWKIGNYQQPEVCLAKSGLKKPLNVFKFAIRNANSMDISKKIEYVVLANLHRRWWS